MSKKNSKFYNERTKANSVEGMGVQTEINPAHPLNSIDRYPGDSVDEHKAKEDVNVYFAEKEIEQEDNNL
ncbi:hypothetical protein [Aquibacillus salsiterrae]|uniref:Uncharacterized protein n=1 Tax=Aquibacillus salsiterrae TaxID=2950439 RepID=A0A9X3WCR2_9BACI|nr:hypothetical protein [Aquibacillus salsiterrae]MDC3417132.1 hypothetical protein [Aquibacillus salsiterrae]